MSLRLVILGLSLSSSWGNGHATTYRALIKGLAARGHSVLFLERDVAWYAQHRDFTRVDYCDLRVYENVAGLEAHRDAIRAADAVILGSYVPDGVAVARLLRRWARRLAFYDIDTPITVDDLRRDQCAYLDASAIPGFDLYLSFTGGPMLDVLVAEFGARRACALYCAVDEALHKPRARPLRYDLSYLGTYSADRQPVLDRLLLESARRAPHLRFAVAGPQYPAGIDWPANVARIDHIAPQDHADFYASSAYTLNITRAAMRAAGYSPSVRLFEAAAAGAPLISDDWAGMREVLEPGREILVASDAADVLAALARPAHERRAIAKAARTRALAQHTGAFRAAELEAMLTIIQPDAKAATLSAA